MNTRRSGTTMVCISLGELIHKSPRSNLYMIIDTGMAEWLPHKGTRYLSPDTALVPEWLYDQFVEHAREKRARKEKRLLTSQSDPRPAN